MSSWIVFGAAAAAGFGALGMLLYVLPFPIKWKQRREARVRIRHQRCLVLTYDDGPSEEITPRLLSLLSSYRAPATFFLLGEHAAANPGLVERLVREGHEVGCHSARHLDPWATLPWKLTRDMAEGYRFLSPWIRDDAPYRPPYGKPFLPVFVAAAFRRARLAWWTIDSGDTFAVRPSVDRTLARVRSAGGGIVLMHDHREDSEVHARYVLELTERLLRLARDEGLVVKRFSELFASSPTAGE